MEEMGIIIKAYKVLSLVGGTLSAYKVDVEFTEAPTYANRYTVCAKSDKVAADKGLRRFITDVAATRPKK